MKGWCWRRWRAWGRWGWIFAAATLVLLIIGHQMMKSHLYANDVSAALLSESDEFNSGAAFLLLSFLFMRLVLIVATPPLVLTIIGHLAWQRFQRPAPEMARADEHAQE